MSDNIRDLTKDVLLEAKALIANPENWTSGTPYNVRNGKRCYCLGGALAKVISGEPEAMYSPILREHFSKFVEFAGIPKRDPDEFEREDYPDWEPDTCIYTFNDNSDHETVLAALDRAIAALDE